MNVIWAMASKDIRLALRDKAGFFFTFLLPIGMAALMGTVFGGGGGGGSNAMNIAVVDLDKSANSTTFVKRLDDSDEIAVARIDDRAAAEQLVRTGKQSAVVVLPKGFGDGIDSMFSGKPTEIEVGVDPARKAEAGMLEGALMRYAFMNMQSMFTDTTKLRGGLSKSRESVRTDPDMPDNVRGALEQLFGNLDAFATDLEAATSENEAKTATDGKPAAADDAGPEFSPVKIVARSITAERRGPPNAFAVTFPQGIVWGLIACCLTFAVSMVLERTRGTLMRLRVAPVSTAQLLGAKALACFLTAAGMMTLLMLLARIKPFNVHPNSLPLLAVAIAAIAICFVGIMMVVAAVSKTEAAANGLGWGVFMVAAMFGGGMIPLFMMKGWMQQASNFSPVKWSVLALEGAIWRGFSPAEMLTPCGILVGIGVVSFAIGAWLAQRTSAG